MFALCVCFLSTDRYVIYGNHRDSWVHGAIDPSSGTSVMLELTRVLGVFVKQGEEGHGFSSYRSARMVLDKRLISAPLCGRQMEASKVHYLWKLGSGGVRPYWVCRIHGGDLQLIHKIRRNTKQANVYIIVLLNCFKARLCNSLPFFVWYDQ